MIASYPERRFTLWEYRVGHGSLLFRSPKTDGWPRNVDVIFVGVDYLAAPTVLNGLTVERGLDADLLALVGTPRKVEPQQLFVLVSAGRRDSVVAAHCRATENDGDIFDSRFDLYGSPS